MISFIIPAYNARRDIGACVDAIAINAQRAPGPSEILIVDSSEEIDQRIRLDDRPIPITITPLERRVSPGIARNIGASQARGDFLVFVDADVTLAADALENIRRHIAEGYKVFGGALEASPASRKFWGVLEHYFFNHEAIVTGPARRRKNLSSAFLAVDKSVFERLGGFKDIARMQDTELTERMVRGGIGIFFFPDMWGYQKHASGGRSLLRKVFITGHNLFFIRYSCVSRLRLLAFTFFLPLAALSKSLRIIGRHLVHQRWKGKVKAAFLAPFILGLGCIWMGGFYGALISRRGLRPDR